MNPHCITVQTRFLASTLLCALILGCGFEGFVSGKFSLSQSSKLPVWFNKPQDINRQDITVEFVIYEGTITSKGKVKVFISSKGRMLDEAEGIWRWHPKSLKADHTGPPTWIIMEIQGVKEVYAQPARNDILINLGPELGNKLTDDQVQQEKVLQQLAFKQKEEDFQKLATDRDKFYELDDLAYFAFAIGDYDNATKYAKQLVDMAPNFKGNWNYGNAIHKGNILLGRLALLVDGDIGKSKVCLIAAGKTPGSPQLNTFGPEMSLAKDLLERGEREIVLEYLELIRSFWEMDSGDIDRWKNDIEKGIIPDF